MTQIVSSKANRPQNGKMVYTARTHTTGGRENGVARSSDGRLNVKLSPPGSTGVGTNPEQMFAAGWSACFEGALTFVAKKRKISVPEDLAIDAEVNLNSGEEGFFLSARLNVSLPGVDRETARVLIEEAHKTCPYSKATSGSIDVEINLV